MLQTQLLRYCFRSFLEFITVCYLLFQQTLLRKTKTFLITISNNNFQRERIFSKGEYVNLGIVAPSPLTPCCLRLETKEFAREKYDDLQISKLHSSCCSVNLLKRSRLSRFICEPRTSTF